MWYLPDKTNTYRDNMNAKIVQQNDNICAKASTMHSFLNQVINVKNANDILLNKCCQAASYFDNKPK